MAKRRMNREGTIVFHKGTGYWMVQTFIEGHRFTTYSKTKALTSVD